MEAGSVLSLRFALDSNQPSHGSLYDESRRRQTLAAPEEETLQRALKPDDWNAYEIHAEGPHIVLKLNGITTVDYTEADAAIPQTGRIALQIHSGPAMEARFRNIELREL